MPTAAIVLAAGSASRMGRMKQLLEFRGTTLVERAAATAREAVFEPVVVVVGAEAEAVREVLARAARQAMVVVENPFWKTGMGSSIAAGVRCLQTSGGLEAAAILLADQPLITARHLRAMQELLNRSAGQIVAARYGGSIGVPAIFRRALFPNLLALEGEAGARSLLRNPEQAVIPFDLPEAAIDVDTPEDFAELARRT